MTTLECSDPERVRDQYSVMGRGASGPPGHVVPSRLVTSGTQTEQSERASRASEHVPCNSQSQSERYICARTNLERVKCEQK